MRPCPGPGEQGEPVGSEPVFQRCRADLRWHTTRIDPKGCVADYDEVSQLWILLPDNGYSRSNLGVLYLVPPTASFITPPVPDPAQRNSGSNQDRITSDIPYDTPSMPSSGTT